MAGSGDPLTHFLIIVEGSFQAMSPGDILASLWPLALIALVSSPRPPSSFEDVCNDISPSSTVAPCGGALQLHFVDRLCRRPRPPPPSVDTGRGWTQAAAGRPPLPTLPTGGQRWATLNWRVVDTALAQNLDIRQAAARIDEARALRDRAAGQQLPAVSAGASVNHRRQKREWPAADPLHART